MTPGTLLLALLLSAFTAAQQQTSTTLVSVTRTTTVRVTATDYANACENFYGACVVYGDGNAAGYTTTVYRYAPSTTPSTLLPTSTPIVTSTTTFLATTTASNSDACNDFSGACVVYGGDATSTVYNAGSDGSNNDNNDHAGLGDDDGYIAAQGDDGGEGQLGGTAGAMALKRCTYEALIALGLAVGVAALLV